MSPVTSSAGSGVPSGRITPRKEHVDDLRRFVSGGRRATDADRLWHPGQVVGLADLLPSSSQPTTPASTTTAAVTSIVVPNAST